MAAQASRSDSRPMPPNIDVDGSGSGLRSAHLTAVVFRDDIQCVSTIHQDPGQICDDICGQNVVQIFDQFFVIIKRSS